MTLLDDFPSRRELGESFDLPLFAAVTLRVLPF
jgi:hypothetical protein